jgi:hypothetical protein
MSAFEDIADEAVAEEACPLSATSRHFGKWHAAANVSCAGQKRKLGTAELS